MYLFMDSPLLDLEKQNILQINIAVPLIGPSRALC